VVRAEIAGLDRLEGAILHQVDISDGRGVSDVVDAGHRILQAGLLADFAGEEAANQQIVSHESSSIISGYSIRKQIPSKLSHRTRSRSDRAFYPPVSAWKFNC
jgi:hypothetical protein